MKYTVRIIAYTSETTFMGKPALVTEEECGEIETLIQQAVEGKLAYLQFDLENEEESVLLSKEKILRSSFVIRKKNNEK